MPESRTARFVWAGRPSSEQLAGFIRRAVIEESYRARVGHIGSALSVSDVLASIYSGNFKFGGGADTDRDRFVLSKGHAALALYATLAGLELMEEATLGTYCTEGSLLGVHPERELAGIDFSTGSLGQGFSIAVGAALAARIQGSSRRTVVLASDAELNEGVVWEAALFAGHHKLPLVAVFDMNGQQALGFTREVLDTASAPEVLEGLGWTVLRADGHDHADLAAVLRAAATTVDFPVAIFAETIFGRGVSFMESQIEWHYLPLDEEQFRAAQSELDALDPPSKA